MSNSGASWNGSPMRSRPIASSARCRAEAERLIRAGELKRAVEAAKELLRRSPTPESEAVLAQAYVARILSFEPRMAAEADALFEPARDKVYRHPTFYAIPEEVKNI